MKVFIGPYEDGVDQVQEIEIHNYDTWSMDRTLAPIILPMLKQLKETKHGAPNVDMTDVPENLRINDPESKAFWSNDETDEKFLERWDWIMDEMIFAFNSKVDESWEEQFESGTSDLQWVELDDGYSEVVEGPNHTKVYDLEGRKAHQERMSNGFRLFGKYYENLWD